MGLLAKEHPKKVVHKFREGGEKGEGGHSVHSAAFIQMCKKQDS